MSSTFPVAWKSAIVIPIPKVPSPSCPSDYRPISILPCISKILELLIDDQIKNFVNVNLLLDPFQSGFRRGHSTTSALLRVTHDISRAMNNSEFSVLVLLDFTKAFDSINHALLCEKLRLNFGFSTESIKFVASYLRERSQIVKLNNILSSPCSVSSGVPQGSILGPLLFSLFINDLPSCLQFSSHHLYADDCQIYVSGSVADVDVVFSKINSDLACVAEWAKFNGLVLNPAKSQAIIIARRPLCHGVAPLLLNGVNIEFTNSVRNLGLVMNDTLTWSNHVNAICSKVNYSLYALRQLRKFTPQHVRLLLVRSLIVPFFLYCDVIFYNLDSVSKRRLTVAFNSCIRYVHDLGIRDHVSPFSNSILDCPLFPFLNYRAVVFLFKLLRLKEPEYLFSLFKRSHLARTGNLIVPQSKSRNFARTIFVHGAVLWNGLPHHVKLTSSLSDFKSAALEHFSGDD